MLWAEAGQVTDSWQSESHLQLCLGLRDLCVFRGMAGQGRVLQGCSWMTVRALWLCWCFASVQLAVGYEAQLRLCPKCLLPQERV